MHACITFHQIRAVQMCHSYCILGCAQDFLCDHIIMYLFNNLPFSVLILCISHFLTSLFNLLSLLIRFSLCPFPVSLFALNFYNGQSLEQSEWNDFIVTELDFVTN